MVFSLGNSLIRALFFFLFVCLVSVPAYLDVGCQKHMFLSFCFRSDNQYRDKDFKKNNNNNNNDT